MPGCGIAEDHSAVTDHRDHQVLRLGELGAESRPDAPAQTARRTQAEIGPRPQACTRIEPELVLVEDQCIGAGDLADATAEKFGRDRGVPGGMSVYLGTASVGAPDCPAPTRCDSRIITRDAFCERGFQRPQ